VSFDLKESRFSAGEAATFIGDNDERAMGQSFIDLLADPQLRARMSEIGVQRIKNGLSWDESEKVLIEFYDQLLGHSLPGDRSIAA
jgi:glycosyltransferase involved in cell wall biosynthesis